MPLPVSQSPSFMYPICKTGLPPSATPSRLSSKKFDTLSPNSKFGHWLQLKGKTPQQVKHIGCVTPASKGNHTNEWTNEWMITNEWRWRRLWDITPQQIKHIGCVIPAWKVNHGPMNEWIWPQLKRKSPRQVKNMPKMVFVAYKWKLQMKWMNEWTNEWR